MPTPNRVLHVALPLADGQVLLGSDRPVDFPAGVYGDSVALNVSVADADDARRIFEGLAEGGRIQMPFGRQFWGADLGMCTDRFGIYWMVGCDRAG